MACRDLDGQVARRDDPEISALLDRFVCVRLVQAWGLDLSLFQFDGDLTWAVFFLNADRSLYGRYGTRTGHDATQTASIEGFRKAMEGALELHAAYPGNRESLAAKTAPAPAWPVPEEIPTLKGRFQEARTGSMACIHCHTVREGLLRSNWREGRPPSDADLWCWPTPDLLGLALDVKERATAASVETGSAAARAGLQAGDRIARMDGQPIVSVADVQWALQTARDPGPVSLHVLRGDKTLDLRLDLPEGWRRKADFTAWRSSAWALREEIAAFACEPLPVTDKEALGVAADAPALRVRELYAGDSSGGEPARGADVRPGDVIVGIDGGPAPASEAALLAHILQRKKPGESLELKLLRAGRPAAASLPLR